MTDNPKTGIFSSRFFFSINHYLLSVIIIGITVIICAPLSNSQSYHVVSFILLFVVSFLATFMRMGSVLLAAALSAIVWNFFFIPPHFTFHIDKVEDILMFGMFFIIALLNGILTTRVRRQKQLAKEREERTSALFLLTKGLSNASGIDAVLNVARDGIENNFSCQSVFFLQNDNKLSLATSGNQPEKELNEDVLQQAQWAFNHSVKAGKFTNSFSEADYTFYPLMGTRLNTGVVAIKSGKPLKEDQETIITAFITLISNALEREYLGELAQKARFLDESDKLYKALFNSISHELRIPVATIMGASDTLLTSEHSGKDQSVLFSEIFTASLRLNRLIENLLNMSRLESGRISAHLDWYDINDLVNEVSQDLKDELKPFSFVVSVPDDIPLVKIDYGLMIHVLYNLVFNATQHAPAASEIGLSVSHRSDELIIEVENSGASFSEQDIKNVFKKFFRVEVSRAGGLGLGLSIVKGFVEAHNGKISVNNRKGGGVRFTISIPTSSPQIENAKMMQYD